MGGVNFIAVKFSNEELAPMYGATLRFAGATLIFVAFGLLRRVPWPTRREFIGTFLYGVLGFGVAYALLYYALVRLPAGTVSVIMASVPLVTLVFAVLHRQERFSLRGVIGGFLAMAGIGVLSTGTLSGEIGIGYFIAALLAVVAVAESSIAIKGFPMADPVAVNGIAMGVGALFLAVFSLILGEPWVVPSMDSTWLALGWLVVFGSVGLFVLYLYVISRWTASATNYAVTLMPVVAVTAAALLADEPVTVSLLVGGALVLLAVYVGALSGGPSPSGEEPGAAREPVEVPSS